MSECIECGRSFEYKRNKGGTKTVCNSCYVNRRRFKIKEQAVAYCGGKCSRCGYDKCNAALEFHHVDESTKSFEISGSHSRSWKAIENELDKCIMVCANCHRELHAEQQSR